MADDVIISNDIQNDVNFDYEIEQYSHLVMIVTIVIQGDLVYVGALRAIRQCAGTIDVEASIPLTPDVMKGIEAFNAHETRPLGLSIDMGDELTVMFDVNDGALEEFTVSDINIEAQTCLLGISIKKSLPTT